MSERKKRRRRQRRRREKKKKRELVPCRSFPPTKALPPSFSLQTSVSFQREFVFFFCPILIVGRRCLRKNKKKKITKDTFSDKLVRLFYAPYGTVEVNGDCVNFLLFFNLLVSPTCLPISFQKTTTRFLFLLPPGHEKREKEKEKRFFFILIYPIT